MHLAFHILHLVITTIYAHHIILFVTCTTLMNYMEFCIAMGVGIT
jgi:hypothetical protein